VSLRLHGPGVLKYGIGHTLTSPVHPLRTPTLSVPSEVAELPPRDPRVVQLEEELSSSPPHHQPTTKKKANLTLTVEKSSPCPQPPFAPPRVPVFAPLVAGINPLPWEVEGLAERVNGHSQLWTNDISFRFSLTVSRVALSMRGRREGELQWDYRLMEVVLGVIGRRKGTGKAGIVGMMRGLLVVDETLREGLLDLCRTSLACEGKREHQAGLVQRLHLLLGGLAHDDLGICLGLLFV